MIEFARLKTDLGPTSEYTLVRDCLNLFIAMVNEDIHKTFHDLPEYMVAYEELFTWTHQANLGNDLTSTS